MSSSDYTVPCLINGEEYHPTTTFDVVAPATGNVIHRCGSANVDDATRATDAAAEAFKTWRKTLPAERRDIFLRAADILEKRRAELVQYPVEETGCTQQWSDLNITITIQMVKDIAGRISTIEGTFPRMADPDASAIVLREPYGVVLAIAPWNAPYILGTRAVVSPIAAGNTVVFKASEKSPRTLLAIANTLEEAGLPKGVINVIYTEPAGAAAVTNALIANSHVKKINFTGSTNVGRLIGKTAGQYLKPLVLELGGKAPAIVWEDANLDLAAEKCALGAYLNSGQICMSTEKIIVHKAVESQFKEKLSAAVANIFSSQPDAPVLINSDAVAKNKSLITDATSKGASLIYGDVKKEEKTDTRLQPIAIGGVTPEMDIYKTESFGPTVSVITIETEEEALRIANDTEYGLTSAVFTEDLRRGLRFAKEIDTGAVHINDMSVHDENALPHGGSKASGYGRFNSSAGLEEWVKTKTVTFRN